VRKLKGLGFDGPFPGGRHEWMRKGSMRVTVPNPHEGGIDPGLIRRILHHAKISADEWNNA
jgi:predicted RNA binding protein YcfA (HicA-like mRNA interferase family)